MKSRLAVTGVVLLVTSALLACGGATTAPAAAPTPVTVAETGDWSAYPGAAETDQDAQVKAIAILRSMVAEQYTRNEALEARIAELERQLAIVQELPLRQSKLVPPVSLKGWRQSPPVLISGPRRRPL